ncbi:MAG: flagellar biosynthesis anti-sigma factor FlgM [Bacteriovoracaceae bacterium]|nr:flagellar biosynthesis anti-sigma factor FlgM [Bacteriovoracaceae bacterium]
MTDVSKTRPNFFPNSPTAKEAKRKAFENLEQAQDTNGAQRSNIGGVKNNDARVEIPESIKDFSQIKRAVDQSGPIDNSKKIAELKSKIASGQYEIDYDGVANKMLESEY